MSLTQTELCLEACRRAGQEELAYKLLGDRMPVPVYGPRCAIRLHAEGQVVALCHHFAMTVSPDDFLKFLMDFEDKKTKPELEIRLPSMFTKGLTRAKFEYHKARNHCLTALQKATQSIHVRYEQGRGSEKSPCGCKLKIGMTWEIWADDSPWRASLVIPGAAADAVRSFGPGTLDELYNELRDREALEILTCL